MEVTCDNCGAEFDKYPSKVKRSEHDFCSRECSDEYQKIQFSGEGNPNYVGGEYTCEKCGETIESTPYDAEHRIYCSRECMSEDRKGMFSGENNPSYNGGKDEVECEWCGDVVELTPAIAEDRRFCSDGCYKEWLSKDRQGEKWVGEDNPSWNGGMERHRFYGPNWEDQRQKVLERDGEECQLCETGEDLHIHHKTPIDKFDRDVPGWYRQANDTDNLVTLCRGCHKSVHHNPEDHFGDLIG